MLNFKEEPYGDIKKIQDIPDHDILLANFHVSRLFRWI